MKSIGNEIKKFSVKSKIMILSFLFSVCSVSLIAQNNDSITMPDTHQPDVKIKVNREFDKDGNVVKYDSTYTWSWSSDGNQNFSVQFFNDTATSDLLQHFDNFDFFDDSFFRPFGNNMDSLFSRDPNVMNFGNMERQMQEMIQRQQQMMRVFFGEPPSEIIPEPKNDKPKQENPPVKKTSTGGIDI
jgi:hypothetical protein